MVLGICRTRCLCFNKYSENFIYQPVNAVSDWLQLLKHGWLKIFPKHLEYCHWKLSDSLLAVISQLLINEFISVWLINWLLCHGTGCESKNTLQCDWFTSKFQVTKSSFFVIMIKFLHHYNFNQLKIDQSHCVVCLPIFAFLL